MITVAPASPRDPGPRALLQASHALMEELFPSEANHYLDLTALEAPTIRLYAASENGETLATGALAIKDGYGEVKSMFTAPAARGLQGAERGRAARRPRGVAGRGARAAGPQPRPSPSAPALA